MTAALPFTFALLWASSYAGAKIGLEHISPLAFVALRLSVAAGAATLVMLAVRRGASNHSSTVIHLMVGGALLHGLGLAPTHVAMVEIAATPTALVHAVHPIVTAALGALLLGERLGWWQWTGVALGFAGVLLGVPLTLGTANLSLLGASLVGLTGGTLYLRRFGAAVAPFEATAMQLVGGALLALALTALFETPHVEPTPSFIAAMAWNTLVMSVFGIAIYNLMLDRHGASRASSGFFVVPGASALIAFVLLGEEITTTALLGLAAATAGVALVWWRGRN